MKLRSGTIYKTLVSQQNDSIDDENITLETRVMPARMRSYSNLNTNYNLRPRNVNGFVTPIRPSLRPTSGPSAFTHSDIKSTLPPLTTMEAVNALLTLKGVNCCSRKNKCALWGAVCCTCADLRPYVNKYYAYDNSWLKDYTTVSREFYYCAKCSSRNK